MTDTCHCESSHKQFMTLFVLFINKKTVKPPET